MVKIATNIYLKLYDFTDAGAFIECFDFWFDSFTKVGSASGTVTGGGVVTRIERVTERCVGWVFWDGNTSSSFLLSIFFFD